MDDRACLNGILFVLSTGIRWDRLPQQLGYGSGMTCWRRLRDWQQAGVWDRLHALLLAELQASGRIDWSRAVADSSHLRAKRERGHCRQPQRRNLAAAADRADPTHSRPARTDAGDAETNFGDVAPRAVHLAGPQRRTALATPQGGPRTRAPDFDLVLSAYRLALLGQRRGQRSALLYLRLP
jgi:transposase